MNFLRNTLILPALRRQPSKRIHPRSRIKPQHQQKRNPGFLYRTLLPLKSMLSSQVIHSIETPVVQEILTPRTFFRKLDEPLRFIFKVPFVQDFYTIWLKAEELELAKSLEEKSYFLFLGEFAFYGKLGIETFEKLILSSYPDIAKMPEYRENVIIFHHLITKNKNHIEESLYQLEREKKDNSEDEGREAPGPLSTRNYYRYIDLNVRPLFKFEIMQVLFGRWLKLEEVSINDCYEARYHNLFIEELLYYYDQGEGFVRSIVKNIYTTNTKQKLTEEELNNIYILIRTFDAILDETVKKIKDSQGDLKDMDRKAFLNHGYDFGMILYYVANKDAFNALMTARSLVIETASKIWEKKKKASETIAPPKTEE